MMAKKPVGMPVGKPVTSAEENSGVNDQDEAAETETTFPTENQNSATIKKVDELRYTLSLVDVTIPRFDGLDGYVTKRFEVRLKGTEASILRSIRAGLEQQGCKLADGRHIKTPLDAVRWLIQQVGDATHDSTNAG
jgi:hypothetical protein